jgi:hypothetical protein
MLQGLEAQPGGDGSPMDAEPMEEAQRSSEHPARSETPPPKMMLGAPFAHMLFALLPFLLICNEIEDSPQTGKMIARRI